MLKIHEFKEENGFAPLCKVYLNGRPAAPTFARVSAVPHNEWWRGRQRAPKDTETAPFVSFESDEPVEVRVISDKLKTAAEVIVRPQSKGVSVTRGDGEAVFSLSRHGAYTFEIDGFHEALHLFYNPERDYLSEETRSGRKILHYAAGVYEIGAVEIGSHTSVVLDAGAIVYGSFTAIGAEDIRICGYGMIDGGRETRTDDTLLLPTAMKPAGNSGAELVYTDEDLTNESVLREKMRDMRVLNGCIRFYSCRDFSVEGVILRDCATFCLIPAASENFVIDNVKTIGMWRYNSDGIDLFNCAHAVIKNCFLRNFDDCMVIKGIVGWEKRNNEDILVENCVVWCDWGSALEIGAETNAPAYRNITFRNCDIIHGQAAVMRIHHHNAAKIENILYDGICAEFTKHQLPGKIIEDGKAYDGQENTGHPELIVLVIVADGKYGKEKRRGTIENVRIRNTRVFADGEVKMPISAFLGADEAHKVKNATVENVYLNGALVPDYDAAIRRMKYTENIRYKVT